MSACSMFVCQQKLLQTMSKLAYLAQRHSSTVYLMNKQQYVQSSTSRHAMPFAAHSLHPRNAVCTSQRNATMLTLANDASVNSARRSRISSHHIVVDQNVAFSTGNVLCRTKRYKRKGSKDRRKENLANQIDLQSRAADTSTPTIEEMKILGVDLYDYQNSLNMLLDEMRQEYAELNVQSGSVVLDELGPLSVETTEGMFKLFELAQIGQTKGNVIMVDLAANPQYISDVQRSISGCEIHVTLEQDGTTLLIHEPAKDTEGQSYNLAMKSKIVLDKIQQRMGNLRDEYFDAIATVPLTHEKAYAIIYKKELGFKNKVLMDFPDAITTDLLMAANTVIAVDFDKFSKHAEGYYERKTKELIEHT